VRVSVREIASKARAIASNRTPAGGLGILNASSAGEKKSQRSRSERAHAHVRDGKRL